MSQLCSCITKPRIKQKCRKHPAQYYLEICLEGKCFTALCRFCRNEHRNMHKQNGIAEPQIKQIHEIQQQYRKIIQSDLQRSQYKLRKAQVTIKEIQCDPNLIIERYLNEFFYDTLQKRVLKLKQRKQMIKKEMTIHNLIEIIGQSRYQYQIKIDFSQKFRNFMTKNLIIDNR